MDYMTELTSIRGEREKLAGFYYDVVVYRGSIQPVDLDLVGMYLKFESMQDLAAFNATVPLDLDYAKLIRESAQIFGELFEEAKAKKNFRMGVELASKMTAVLMEYDLKSVAPVITEAGRLAEESNLPFLRGWVHDLYGSYYDATSEYREALNHLHHAQAEFEKVGEEVEWWLWKSLKNELVCLKNFTLQDPGAAFEESWPVYVKLEALYLKKNRLRDLIALYVDQYKWCISCGKPELIAEPLLKMLPLIKKRIPDDYSRQLELVTQEFQKYGLADALNKLEALSDLKLK